MLGGERPSRERQCPFLLPAMQTETEKDQIPKFLFKPRCRSPGGGTGTVTWVARARSTAALRDKERIRVTMALQLQVLVSVPLAAASQGPKRGCAGLAYGSACGHSPTR